jgi:hypothetical protein
MRDLHNYKVVSKDSKLSTVYALLLDGEIMYIGKTNNINIAISKHNSQNSIYFNEYAVIKHFNTDSSSMEVCRFAVEKILEYKPISNGAFINNYKEVAAEVRYSSMNTKEKIRTLIDHFPMLPPKEISDIVGIELKTIYKHLTGLGAENVRKASHLSQDDFENWGVDQQDSWLDGDGSF